MAAASRCCAIPTAIGWSCGRSKPEHPDEPRWWRGDRPGSSMKRGGCPGNALFATARKTGGAVVHVRPAEKQRDRRTGCPDSHVRLAAHGARCPCPGIGKHPAGVSWAWLFCCPRRIKHAWVARAWVAKPGSVVYRIRRAPATPGWIWPELHSISAVRHGRSAGFSTGSTAHACRTQPRVRPRTATPGCGGRLRTRPAGGGRGRTALPHGRGAAGPAPGPAHSPRVDGAQGRRPDRGHPARSGERDAAPSFPCRAPRPVRSLPAPADGHLSGRRRSRGEGMDTATIEATVMSLGDPGILRQLIVELDDTRACFTAMSRRLPLSYLRYLLEETGRTHQAIAEDLMQRMRMEGAPPPRTGTLLGRLRARWARHFAPADADIELGYLFRLEREEGRVVRHFEQAADRLPALRQRLRRHLLQLERCLMRIERLIQEAQSNQLAG